MPWSRNFSSGWRVTLVIGQAKFVFLPYQFLSTDLSFTLTPAKRHLNHSPENQLHVSKAEQSSNLNPVLIQSLFCFKLPTHSLFPAAEPHNVQRPHTRCKSNRGLLKIKVQQLSQEDRLQHCCLENGGKEWDRRADRTVGDPYRKQWESTLESILQKSPILSSTDNRDTQSFLYEHRQESAQKKSCCFPEARWDTRVPGFVLSLAESWSKTLSVPYFPFLSKRKEA